MLSIIKKAVIYSVFLSVSIFIYSSISLAEPNESINLILEDLDFSRISNPNDVQKGVISFKIFYEGTESNAVSINRKVANQVKIIVHYNNTKDTVVKFWGWKDSSILKNRRVVENPAIYKFSSSSLNEEAKETVKIPFYGENGYIQASLRIEKLPAESAKSEKDAVTLKLSSDKDQKEIEEINADSFDEKIASLKDDSIVVLDFYIDGCYYCIKLKPELKKLRQYLEENNMGHVYTNKYVRGAIKDLSIQSFPTVLIFKNGEVIGKYVGYRKAEFFINEIDKLLEK